MYQIFSYQVSSTYLSVFICLNARLLITEWLLIINSSNIKIFLILSCSNSSHFFSLFLIFCQFSISFPKLPLYFLQFFIQFFNFLFIFIFLSFWITYLPDLLSSIRSGLIPEKDWFIRFISVVIFCNWSSFWTLKRVNFSITQLTLNNQI